MKHEIAYYKNGNKRVEVYYNDLGQFHNENGPAIIVYYLNGSKSWERYFINGLFHNIKGPAKISYIGDDGEIEFEYKYYYLNDTLINVKTDEEFQKYIKKLNIS